MIRRLLLAVITVATIGNLAQAASRNVPRPGAKAVCAVQTMACYHFTGTLLTGAGSLVVTGWSQDLPTPGYVNRWRYVLDEPSAMILTAFQGPLVACVGVGAVIWPDERGGAYAEAFSTTSGEMLWNLEMHPTDPAVADAFSRANKFQEYRIQTFLVSVLNNGGATEIMITEPQ